MVDRLVAISGPQHVGGVKAVVREGFGLVRNHSQGAQYYSGVFVADSFLGGNVSGD